MTSRGARRGVRGKRAGRMIWAGVIFSDFATVAAGAQSVTPILDPDISSQIILAGGTIRRMVGDLMVRPGTTNSTVIARFGILTLNDDAADALVVPEPWSDAADWMYESAGIVSVTSTSAADQWIRVHIDTSVMRKLPQQQRSLIGVMDNPVASETSLEYFLSIKVLVWLP